MGTNRQGRRRAVGSRSLTSSAQDGAPVLIPTEPRHPLSILRVARVRPDVSGLDKVFDYLVPDGWAGSIEIGSLVRFDLHGRRVAGWVVDLDVDPVPGLAMRELRSLSSRGPSAEVVGLAHWAARRWHGRVAAVLKSASPDRMVRSVGPPVGGPQNLRTQAPAAAGGEEAFRHAMVEALAIPDVSVLRVGPGIDRFTAFEVAASVGNAVIVLPDVDEARHLGGRFRRAGGRISLAGRDWAEAARGGLVTGARSAVWATVPNLTSIVVLDEHDERLQEERNPTWHARTVAIERARRLRIPCVLVSPAPSLDALTAADRTLSLSRNAERGAWPRVEIIDRRSEDPGTPGPFSSALAAALRSTAEGRVLAVLNRKGRAQLLACATCGELVRTLDGERVMSEVDGELVASTGERRPKVCALCGATKLKRLRLGVDRAREELEALVGEPVGELTAETPLDQVEQHRIIVGTEAVLHRINRAELVVFLDFDQELLAPRFRAAEQAMALLVLAARVLGGRAGTGQDGRLLVQTRSPHHRVLEAAVRSDPSRWAEAELDLRRSLSLPPFVSLAEVSGAGAEAFVEPLRSNDPWSAVVEVLGPRTDGRYLVRAATADLLADALTFADSVVHRPKQRVRVAVDPPRV